MIFSEVRNIVTMTDGYDCEVNHPTFGWIPFHATPTDVTEHGQKLYSDIQAGKFGTPAAFDPSSPIQKAIRGSEIRSQLVDLDLQSVRPLRAKLAGVSTPEDDDKLAALEAQASALRSQLSSL